MYVFVSDRLDDNLATTSAEDAEEFDLGIGITSEANGVVRRETRSRDEEHRAAKFPSTGG